jgi:flagellar motor switch/type III secretory pathway protein FliN
MATTHSLPESQTAQTNGTAASDDAQAANQALAPLPPIGEEEEETPALRGPIARLPVELDVVIPVRNFRVRHLLALEPGHLIESQWGHGEDMPLSSGDVQLAWSEFEVVETQLAVRVTRLA